MPGESLKGGLVDGWVREVRPIGCGGTAPSINLPEEQLLDQG
jgi:hypothetical protein